MSLIGQRFAFVLPAMLLGGLAALQFGAGAASAQERSLIARNEAGANRCSQLHEYLFRYTVESPSQHHTSRLLRADVALVICDRGEVERGIAMLEAEVRDARLPELAAAK
jgi:hypothetical protein